METTLIRAPRTSTPRAGRPPARIPCSPRGPWSAGLGLLAALLVLSACQAGGEPSAPAESDAADRPNVVLVMTDDQGHGDFGFMGNDVLATPHLDALAEQSARLDRFYVSPVCSPTRASLMTGRYNYRTRVVDTWVGRSMMDPEEITVAEVLRDAGYRTGIFGKWHLGDCYPMRPGDQGFEESLVHFGGGLAQPSEPPENQRRYTDAILAHNGVEVATEGYCTDVYFDAAFRFIEQCRQDDRPFFVYLPTNAPHGPFHDVPEDLRQKYLDQGSDDRTARIFAMIENVDQNVGRLLQRLDDWQLAENTLVIFLQDNGPNGDRFNAGLRGKKSDVYEGGIRSVFWARWPRRFAAGTTSDRIAAHIDLMPTLLEATGAPMLDRVSLDGRSLLPLLEGQSATNWPERTLFLQVHRGNTPQMGFHCAAIGQRHKLVRNSGFGGPDAKGAADRPWQLFDLIEDPGEQHDLAPTQPDRVADLRETYEAWFHDVSATRPDNYEAPRIVIGDGAPSFTRLTKQDWRVDNAAGWGNFGAWKLRVEGQPRFRARVLLTKPLAGRAELEFGAHVFRAESTEPTREFVIEDVTPGPGEVELIARLVHEDGPKAVYQVLLERL